MSQRRLLQGPTHPKDSIGAFISPENGYRGRLERQGIAPKNHMKENLREIRATQQRVREKREEDLREARPLYKLPQFQNVPCKLYEEKENSAQRRASFDNRDFLVRGQSEKRREDVAKVKKSIRAELEEKLEEERRMNDKPDTPRKAPVPRSFETAELAPPSNTDFIRRNRSEALIVAPTRKPLEREEEGGAKHAEFGRVPQYLEQRKAQRAEEEEEMRRRMPDPNCPPGMRLMPEDERLQTLEAEALGQLQRMPFVIETPSMRRKQEALENKLREIENALSIFMKPKVYVAGDR
eukprot:scaffold8601_cov180-Ochromonas_danica.AAC.5